MKMSIHLVLLTLFWIAWSVEGNSGFICPSNLNWWQRGDRCYIYWSTLVPLTYEGGKSECALVGAQLYVPNSESEYDDVAEFITSSPPLFNYVWIGCDEKEDDGVFTCVDGTQLNTSNDWWQDSEPLAGNTEKCIDIKLSTRELLDSTCTDLDIILCEVPAIPLPTTTVLTTVEQDSTGAAPITSIVSTTTLQTTPNYVTNTATTTDTTTTTTATTTTTNTNTTTGTNTYTTNTTTTYNNTTTGTNTNTTTNNNTGSGTGTKTKTAVITKSKTAVITTSMTSARSTFKRQSATFSLSEDIDGSYLQGYCLSGHILEKLQVSSKIQCAGLCLARKDCRSFNHRGEFCTLNSRQKHEVNESFFDSRPGCRYYDRSL